MSSEFVTQLVSDQPTIVVVGKVSSLRSKLIEELEKNELFSLTTQISDDLLSQAYKIIWLIPDVSVDDTWYQEMRSLLHRYQDKLTIVMPVIAGIQAPIDDVYAPWQAKAVAQKKLIVDCNYYYPQALCLFGQDVFAHQAHNNCLAFIAQVVSSGSWYDVGISLYPLTEDAFVRGIEKYVLRPQAHTSVLLRGPEIESAALFGLLQSRYESLFQIELPIVKNQVESWPVIPYTVPEEQLDVKVEKILAEFVPTLPKYRAPEPEVIAPALAAPIFNDALSHPPAQRPMSFTPRPATPPPPPPPALAKTRVITPSATLKDESQTKTPIVRPAGVAARVSEPIRVAAPLVVSPIVTTPPPSVPVDMPVFRPRRVEHTRIPLDDEDDRNDTKNDLKNDAKNTVQKVADDTVPTVFGMGQKSASAPKTTPPLPIKDETETPVQPIDSLSMNDELERIFQAPRTAQRVSRIESSTRTQKKIRHTTKRKRVLFYGGLTFIGVGMGVLFLLGVFWSSQWWLRTTLLQSVQEKTGEGVIAAETQRSLSWSTQLLKLQTQSYGAVFDLQAVSQASALVDVGEHLQKAETTMKEADELTSRLVLTLFGTGVEETTSLVTKLHAQAQRAYESVSLVQAGMDQIQIDDGEHEKTLDSFKTSLSKLNKSLSVEQQLQPILPSLMGTDKRKTYVVLLQNDQELRPTGGYIQAAAFLTFERGVLITHQTMSITALDSRLAGEVTPPADLKARLGEQRWLLRDSNWDPNFPDSAARVAWFIENSLGTKVDGVIALNVQSMRSLLGVVGPLNLSEFNEIVTEKNLYERMEFHSEAVLVANSQTPEYGVSILDAFLKKIIALPAEKVGPLLSTMQEEFEDNQLQMTVFDTQAQTTIATIGWSGSLLTPDCPSRLSSVACQVSSMAQVETNVGVNKANYYLERSIDHHVTINHSAIQHRRTIVYRNTAASNAWPKGPYKAYVRFYVEAEAQIGDITIDGKKVPVSDQTTALEHGKRMVGVELNVPIQETRTLELSYVSPAPTEGDFSFAFFNQVQSGFGTTPTQVTFLPSKDVSPTLVIPSAQVDGAGIAFTPTSSGHGFYGVTVR